MVVPVVSCPSTLRWKWLDSDSVRTNYFICVTHSSRSRACGGGYGGAWHCRLLRTIIDTFSAIRKSFVYTTWFPKSPQNHGMAHDIISARHTIQSFSVCFSLSHSLAFCAQFRFIFHLGNHPMLSNISNTIQQRIPHPFRAAEREWFWLSVWNQRASKSFENAEWNVVFPQPDFVLFSLTFSTSFGIVSCFSMSFHIFF